MSEENLTPDEAARILKCTAKFVRNLIRSGRLKGSVINFSSHKPRYRTTRKWIEEFVAQSEIKSVRVV